MTIIDAVAHAAPSGAESAATLERLRATFATGKTRPLAWRLKQIAGIERMLVEREKEIGEALAADLGRNPHDTWFGEIVGTKQSIVHIRKHLRRWMKPKRQSMPLLQLPGRAWVQYEPLGAVLVIGPWNYPVLLSLCPVVEALAAGNVVVLKPSEVAPAASAFLAKFLPEYVDADAVAVIEGDGVRTQELLALGFDHAFFTGGTEIGKKIMAGAAATLTPVTLELGGKSPVIVAADADLDVAVRRIAWVKLMNSGQTCIAPDYILVDASIQQEFVEKFTRTLVDFQGGRPGPIRIVNDRQFARLAEYLSSTKGRIVAGGSTDAANNGVEPTVVVEPSRDEPLMRNEIFGPILPVVPFASLDDAVAYVNSGSKPLAVYVFTRSKSIAKRVIAAIPAGGAVINHVALHFLIPSLPFGGVGASGMGAYHGEAGFQTFSHRKSVLFKPTAVDLKVVYPPQDEKAQKLLRKLF